jgi:menaquinol-cytochrome c reductase cytochrome b/c subunit
MAEIPESLLRRSAEAKAKALGVPVEQVLAEMKGERPPVEIPQQEPEPEPVAEGAPDGESLEAAEPAEVPPPPEVEAAGVEPDLPPSDSEPAAEEDQETAAAVTTLVEEEPPDTSPNGGGKVASVVSTRPTVPPVGTPEGVRTQRLLTVVKARAIQQVKAEPTDKVNTWPHLMLMEFGALLAITGLLVIMSVVIFSPLLDPANVNATPNPSKAPWYFLGLQELLSYFDPQIAGVTVPTITGIIGFMMIPFVDKNPSTRPSDRKFAIVLFSFFLAGAGTLTMLGVLFRGRGFNFSYPWEDGVFFDDLKDWVDFE